MLFINVYDFFPLILLLSLIISRYILKFNADKILTILIYLISLYFIAYFYMLVLFTRNNILARLNIYFDFSITSAILFVILPLIILLFTILAFLIKKKDWIKFILILPSAYFFILTILYFLLKKEFSKKRILFYFKYNLSFYYFKNRTTLYPNFLSGDLSPIGCASIKL